MIGLMHPARFAEKAVKLLLFFPPTELAEIDFARIVSGKKNKPAITILLRSGSQPIDKTGAVPTGLGFEDEDG
jgi:hypothetical protein